MTAVGGVFGGASGGVHDLHDYLGGYGNPTKSGLPSSISLPMVKAPKIRDSFLMELEGLTLVGCDDS